MEVEMSSMVNFTPLMLKDLFGSRTRVKLLEFFFKKKKEEHFLREITRQVDGQVNSVRRECENLRKIGLLSSQRIRNRKYYKLEENFLLYPELEAMVKKMSRPDTAISKQLSKIKGIRLAVLTGKFIGQEKSKIDLLLVGKIQPQTIGKFLETQEENLQYAVMTEEDFWYRIRCRDKFLLDILRNNDSILALNRLGKNLKF